MSARLGTTGWLVARECRRDATAVASALFHLVLLGALSAGCVEAPQRCQTPALKQAGSLSPGSQAAQRAAVEG
jgi:hypothetical protein